MRIWIVNAHTGSPNKVSNPRYIEYAKNLMRQGYDIVTFNSSSHENVEITKGDYVEKQYGDFKFVHVKGKKYSGNGIKRMLSLYQFAKTMLSIRNKFEKPDIIIHNIHAPFDYPIITMSKRLKAKYIGEVWDIWPKAFVRVGFVKESNPLLKIAYHFEKRMYEKADALVFSMEGGLDYLREQKWASDCGGSVDVNKVYYINNGVNIEKFNQDRQTFTISDPDLNNPSLFKVVYLGSIKMVNHVRTIVDAAKILQSEKDIVFLIYGNGNERESLVEYCQSNNINNVKFKEKRIPFENVAYVVSHSDLNLMNYASYFGKYGISSGKFFQYLAAGKPIVANVNFNYNDIKRYNLGVSDDFSTPEEYASAIKSIRDLSTKDYQEMCERVKQTAYSYDSSVLSQKLISIIKSITDGIDDKKE